MSDRTNDGHRNVRDGHASYDAQVTPRSELGPSTEIRNASPISTTTDPLDADAAMARRWLLSSTPPGEDTERDGAPHLASASNTRIDAPLVVPRARHNRSRVWRCPWLLMGMLVGIAATTWCARGQLLCMPGEGRAGRPTTTGALLPVTDAVCQGELGGGR